MHACQSCYTSTSPYVVDRVLLLEESIGSMPARQSRFSSKSPYEVDNNNNNNNNNKNDDFYSAVTW